MSGDELDGAEMNEGADDEGANEGADDEGANEGADDEGANEGAAARDEAAPSRRSHRRIRRAPVLIVVLGLVVAAVVAQRNASDSSPAAASSPQGSSAVVDGASVAPSGALSASWYCADGTSTADGRADETVLIANTADTRVEATVTVMVGGDGVPPSRQVQVAPGDEQRVHVADIVQNPEPGVVVEVDRGQAVVSHELVHGGDIALEPCTRSAGTDWYFAAGTTLKGSGHDLALFNPFGDDAIVDVTFLTDTGVQQPDALQAVVVPRRSRVTLAVQDAVPRQERVATQVHARVGRVVAERSQSFDGTVPEAGPTRKGFAVSLGAQAPAAEWQIAAGTRRDGGTASLALANFTDRDTTVAVDVILAGEQSLAPQSVAVPARGVVAVDVSGRVPLDTDYAVHVTSPGGANAVPLVAEVLSSWPPGSTVTGVASTLGSVAATGRWIVPAPDVGSGADAYVSVSNPGKEAARARLRQADGTTTERTVASGKVVVFHVAEIGAQAGGMVVSADHPVVVGLTVLGSVGASTSAAIPDYDVATGAG